MLQIELRPECEMLLARRAQEMGLSLDAYVQNLLELGAHEADLDLRARQQAVASMLDFAAKYGAKHSGSSFREIAHDRTQILMPFVLDTSVTMAWCFVDEVSSYSRKALQSLAHTYAEVPALWRYEVANGISRE